MEVCYILRYGGVLYWDMEGFIPRCGGFIIWGMLYLDIGYVIPSYESARGFELGLFFDRFSENIENIDKFAIGEIVYHRFRLILCETTRFEQDLKNVC